MSYRSPVGDILFSLKAVAGLPEMIGVRTGCGLRLGHGFVRRRRGRAFRNRGNRAAQSPRRYRRRAIREWDRRHAARVWRRLSTLGGGRLGRRLGAGRIRRNGTAASGQRRLYGNLERGDVDLMRQSHSANSAARGHPNRPPPGAGRRRQTRAAWRRSHSRSSRADDIAGAIERRDFLGCETPGLGHDSDETVSQSQSASRVRTRSFQAGPRRP